MFLVFLKGKYNIILYLVYFFLLGKNFRVGKSFRVAISFIVGNV